MERLPEQVIEERAGRADLERIANLAEDLSFSRDERVEARRDAEQVQRGTVVAEAVENGGERCAVVPGKREERRAGALVQVEARFVTREVELRAIAGREHDGLAAVRQPARELAAAAGSTATRSRSSTGAWRCETPTRASLTRRSG